MKLKEKLDRIWNTPGCVLPLRKTGWRLTCLGWLRWVKGTMMGKRYYFWKEKD